MIKAAIIVSVALIISLSGAGDIYAEGATPGSSKSREQIAADVKEYAQRHAMNGGQMQRQMVLELFHDNTAGLTPSEIAGIYEEEYTRQKGRGTLFEWLSPSLGWIVAIFFFILTLFRDSLGAYVGRVGDYIFQSLYKRFGGAKFFRRVALRYYKQSLSRRYQKLILPFDRRAIDFQKIFVPPALAGDRNAKSLDALHAVTEFKRVVILGPPGSGKSALLAYIASTYSEGAPDGVLSKTVPVLLQLAKLNGEKLSLQQHIADVFAANGFRDSEAFIEEALHKGKLLLLLDGLDEVSNINRSWAAKQIRDLLEMYPETRAVITCREAAYRNEFHDIADATCTILDLDEQRIHRFLQAWEPQMPADKSAAQLMQSLRERPPLMALARNRLLLTLIVYFYSSVSAPLPASRSELCRVLTEFLLAAWHSQRNRFNLIQKQVILQNLALYIQDHGADWSLERQTTLRLIREQLPKIDLPSDIHQEMLAELVEGSGLLLAIDGGQRYQFSHLILLEYFSASALRDDIEGLTARFKLDPDTWRETVKLCCGLLNDSSKLLANLFQIDTLTAFECLAESRAVNEVLAENIIAAAKERLGSANSYEAVIGAFGVVASSQSQIGERIFNYLGKILGSTESPQRRQAAAEALSLTNMPRAAALLASHYLIRPEVRQPLIRMGDLAVPELRLLAQAGADEVLADLQAIGTPTAAEALAALVPQLRKQIKNLSGRSLDIKIDGRSGFYVKKIEKLQLRVKNLLDEPLEDVAIELEDTAKYSVDGVVDSESHAMRLTLQAGESKILSYSLLISEPGQFDLQLKVNGKVYKDHPLELYATHDNPYIYGPPIKDRYNYFGREEEFNTILNDVQGETGPHRLLIGEQRSGKTSLLYILKSTIQRPIVPVYITLENMPGAATSGGDEIAAFRWILDRLIYELKESGALDKDKEYPTEMKYGDYFGRHLRSLIHELQVAKPSARLCLLVDEGNRILKLREEFQLVMRATLNELGKDMRMVLACSNEFLEYVQESHSSPFKNVFQYTLLRPISDGDLNKLITEPAKRFGYEYEEAAVRRVKEMSGGHPYYVQALCAGTFNNARRENSTLILLAHVKAAETHVVNSHEIRDKFVLGYWNVLKDDPEAMQCLKRLSVGEDTGKTPAETIDKLKARQLIIEIAPQRYRFSAELFRIWVRQLSGFRDTS